MLSEPKDRASENRFALFGMMLQMAAFATRGAA